MLALPTPLTLLTPLTPHHGPSLQSPMTTATATTPYTTGAHGRGPRGSRAPQDVRPGVRATRRQPAGVTQAAVRRRGTTAQRGSASGARSGAGHRPWIWSHLNVILPVPREHLRSRTRHGTSHRVARHGQHICPTAPEHGVSFQGLAHEFEPLPFLPPEDRALLVKSRRRCRPSPSRVSRQTCSSSVQPVNQ